MKLSKVLRTANLDQVMKKEALNEKKVTYGVATNRALSVAHCAKIRRRGKKEILNEIFL